MRRGNDVVGVPGEAVKPIRDPKLGPIGFAFSGFAADGRADLSLVIYNPATTEDAAKVARLLEGGE